MKTGQPASVPIQLGSSQFYCSEIRKSKVLRSYLLYPCLVEPITADPAQFNTQLDQSCREGGGMRIRSTFPPTSRRE